MTLQFNAGVFNILSSRANLHLSYNPVGRSHCRLQNHHGYIKHHHRGMGGSPGDVGELPLFHLRHRHFTYVAAHSPTLLLLYPHHSSFYNPSVASSTSQFILQPFLCFSYITSSSLNSPGEPPMGLTDNSTKQMPLNCIPQMTRFPTRCINVYSLSLWFRVNHNAEIIEVKLAWNSTRHLMIIQVVADFAAY